jgi:hypothetical protein
VHDRGCFSQPFLLQADWDRTFSETSFGFRPKDSAHQAVQRAQAYIASGYGAVEPGHMFRLARFWVGPRLFLGLTKFAI